MFLRNLNLKIKKERQSRFFHLLLTKIFRIYFIIGINIRFFYYNKFKWMIINYNKIFKSNSIN
jgi:hypothetical protein